MRVLPEAVQFDGPDCLERVLKSNTQIQPVRVVASITVKRRVLKLRESTDLCY